MYYGYVGALTWGQVGQGWDRVCSGTDLGGVARRGEVGGVAGWQGEGGGETVLILTA
jgi:hypothetical protein